MASVASVLRVLITGDSSGLRSELAKSQADVEKHAAGISKAAKGMALGFAGAAAAAGAFAVHSADTYARVGNEVLKLQRYTGGTAENASRLRAAFKLAGIDTDTASRALGLFNKNLVAGKLDGFNASLAGQHKNMVAVQKATDGLHKAQQNLAAVQESLHGKTKLTTADHDRLKKAMDAVSAAQAKVTGLSKGAAGAMSALGIKVRDAHGKLLPMSLILPQLADVFAKIQEPSKRSALAMELFGKGGAAMLPFLTRGSKGIAELEKQSDKLGTTLSGKDLKAVYESNKAHRELGLAWEGLQIQIGRYVLPVLDKAVVFLTTMIPKAVAIARGVVATLRPALETLVSGFQHVAEKVKPVADAIEAFVKRNPGTAFKVLAGIIGGALLIATTAWAASMAVAIGEAVALAAPVLAVVAVVGLLVAGVIYAYTHFKVFRTVIDAVRVFLVAVVWPAIQKVAHGIADQWGHLVEWTRQHWGQIQEAIGHIIVVIRDIIGVGVAVVMFIWAHFHNQIMAVVRAVWGQIRAYVALAIGIVRNVIQIVLAVINGDWGKAWDSIKNIFSLFWQYILASLRVALSVMKLVLAIAWGGIKTAASAAWNAIWGAIRAVWDKIKFGVAVAANAVKNAVLAAFRGIKDAMGAVWDGITGAIKAGIRGAVRVIDDFLTGINKVVGLVGVHLNLHIGDPFGGGGPKPITNAPGYLQGGHVPLAAGGIMDSRVGSGFMTNGPRAIVGEGRRNYPEAVIPSDPVHRGRALDLWARMGKMLDVPGFAAGGLLPGLDSVVHFVGGLTGGALDSIRSGAVSLALGPVSKAADLAIGTIPIAFIRALAKGLKDHVYNWAKGTTDAGQSEAGKRQSFLSAAGPGVSILGANFALSSITGGLGHILATIRAMESGGNYAARNPVSTASGAYQFLDTTWGGYGGFPRAFMAPPAVQDAKAAANVSGILARYGGTLEAVPAAWYTGGYRGHGQLNYNPGGPGNPLTVQGYVDRWLAKYASIGGYDSGGLLMPGLTLARNNTGRPETVRTAGHEDAIIARLDKMVAVLGSRAAGPLVHVDKVDAEVDLERAAQQAEFKLMASL